MLGITDLPLFVGAVFLLNVTPGPDTAYIVGRSVAQGRAAGIMSSLGVSAGCCVHALATAFGLTALLAASPTAFTIIKFAGAAYLTWLGLRLIWPRLGSAIQRALFARQGGAGRDGAAAPLDEVAAGDGQARDMRLPEVRLPDLRVRDMRLPDGNMPNTQARDGQGHRRHPPAASPGATAQAGHRNLRGLFLQGFLTNVLNPKVILFFVSFFPQFVDPRAGHQAAAFLVLGAIMVMMSTVWNSLVAWLAGTLTRRVGQAPRLKCWLDRVVGTAFIGLGVRLALVQR